MILTSSGCESLLLGTCCSFRTSNQNKSCSKNCWRNRKIMFQSRLQNNTWNRNNIARQSEVKSIIYVLHLTQTHLSHKLPWIVLGILAALDPCCSGSRLIVTTSVPISTAIASLARSRTPVQWTDNAHAHTRVCARVALVYFLMLNSQLACRQLHPVYRYFHRKFAFRHGEFLCTFAFRLFWCTCFKLFATRPCTV